MDGSPPLQSHTQNSQTQIQVSTARCEGSLHRDRRALPAAQVRQTNSSQKRRKYEKPTNGKRRKLSDLRSYGATALPECVLVARHFTNILSIFSKNHEETKIQRACQVTSRHTELLRTGTLDVNPRFIQELPTALHGLDRLSPSKGKDVYSSPYVMQTSSA